MLSTLNYSCESDAGIIRAFFMFFTYCVLFPYFFKALQKIFNHLKKSIFLLDW